MIYRTLAVRAALTVGLLIAAAPGCRSKAPDAGGDTALARDLAQAQLRSMQAATSGMGDSALGAVDAPLVADSSRTMVVAISPTTAPTSAVQGAAARASATSAATPATTLPPRPSVPTTTAPLLPARTQPAVIAKRRVLLRTRGDTSAAGPCGSPSLAAQRACITAHLAVSDVRLNRVYGALITALREQAHVPSSGRDPRMVRGLRSAQRAWIVARDKECLRRTRGVGGRLWAPARARCLADVSNRRADELDGMLRAARGR